MKNLRRALTLALVTLVASVWALPSPAMAAPPPDYVRLTSTNIDLGDNSWFQGAPIGFAVLSWDTSTGTTITPRLFGYLHLNSARGMHARVQMTYYDVFGTRLHQGYGGTVTPQDDYHHVWHVNGLAPYSSPDIYRVEVALTYEGTSQWLATTWASYYV